MAVILGVHLIGSLAATALGPALQRAHVPTPFTLAGLAYGVVLTALVFTTARWARTRYIDRIGRGHW